jgi:invasion protein IalB
LTSEQFEDWTVECFEPKFEDLGCQATLRVIAGDNSQVVMVVALTGKASGPVAVQMALPLGIDLSAAVQIIVGAGYQNKVPVARCTPAGCLVEGTATPELVAALQRERSGIIVVESETGEKIQLPFSLAGFTKAFEAVLERNGG